MTCRCTLHPRKGHTDACRACQIHHVPASRTRPASPGVGDGAELEASEVLPDVGERTPAGASLDGRSRKRAGSAYPSMAVTPTLGREGRGAIPPAPPATRLALRPSLSSAGRR